MTSSDIIFAIIFVCGIAVALAIFLLAYYKEPYHSKGSSAPEEKYKVTAEILWGGHVPGATTGEILVIVHNTNFDSSHLGNGSYASPGLQEAAEYGKVNKLQQELAKIPGTFLYKYDPVACPANVTFEVPADANHPYITVITMLRPSQDFFILAQTDIFKTFIPGVDVSQSRMICPQFSYGPLYALKASTQRRSIFVTEPKDPVLAKERIRYFSLDPENFGNSDQVAMGWLGICAV